MLADHFTKPLQGITCRRFHAEIQGIPADVSETEMGWDQITNSEETPAGTEPSPQECVEQTAKAAGSKDPGLGEGYLLERYLKREPAGTKVCR
jgi:hypothetical protein